jgi:hypothetical protein
MNVAQRCFAATVIADFEQRICYWKTKLWKETNFLRKVRTSNGCWWIVPGLALNLILDAHLILCLIIH